MVVITLESLAAAKPKEPKSVYVGDGPTAHDPMEVDDVYRYPSVEFTAEDISIEGPHNRPLYLTGEINGVSFPRCLVDNGSDINIMPFSTFQRAGLHEVHLNKQPYPILGIESGSYSVGTVMIELVVGEIVSNTVFYVMHLERAFHLILGREWLHRHHGVASSLHQCFRGVFHDKPVTIRATPNPFASHEFHLPEAQLFL